MYAAANPTENEKQNSISHVSHTIKSKSNDQINKMGYVLVDDGNVHIVDDIVYLGYQQIDYLVLS